VVANVRGMDETYRMLGREREADLAREAAARQRAAALERAGGLTIPQPVDETVTAAPRGRIKLALLRLVPARSV
jgi:hypothetical protein